MVRGKVIFMDLLVVSSILIVFSSKRGLRLPEGERKTFSEKLLHLKE